MVDIIFCAPDADYLALEAARLGFVEDDDKTIVVNGTFASGGGWFLNIVGIIYEPVKAPENPDDLLPEPIARNGYWGRLRLNGAPNEMPKFSDPIIKYTWDDALGGWSSDGRTLAPDWVSEVGMIA